MKVILALLINKTPLNSVTQDVKKQRKRTRASYKECVKYAKQTYTIDSIKTKGSVVVVKKIATKVLPIVRLQSS